MSLQGIWIWFVNIRLFTLSCSLDLSFILFFSRLSYIWLGENIISVTKNEQIVSCIMNKLIPLIFLQFIFLEPSLVFAQEVNAELVTISNGRNYFSFTGTSQPPLIVRGIWAEDAYMWVPLNIGDTLAEMAFVNEEPFTGKSVAFDSIGNVIARYQFENGFNQKIDEYKGKDTLRY